MCIACGTLYTGTHNHSTVADAVNPRTRSGSTLDLTWLTDADRPRIRSFRCSRMRIIRGRYSHSAHHWAGPMPHSPKLRTTNSSFDFILFDHHHHHIIINKLIIVACSRGLTACIIVNYLAESSSSRMRFMSHNWSATKQRLHPQSVAEISRHTVLSGQDSTMWDIGWLDKIDQT